MDSGVAAIRQHIDRARLQRDAAVCARVAAVRAALPKIVRALVARGARDVWLFGSLAGGKPHERSDLDLAVTGLAPENYFAALADACEASPVDVDLVTMEDAPASLRERILATGQRLHA